MGKSTAPKGKNKKGKPASKKIFELPMGSPANLFTHILPLLVLLKV
jgi:hypothetical protein